MNYVKEIFKRGSIGLLLGVFISYTSIIILAAFNDGEITVQLNLLIFQFLISSFVGFYSAAGSVVYNVEHWSLLRQTITHFLLMSVYLPISYIAGWMPRRLSSAILFVVFYLVFYIIQWIIFYSFWKRKAAELNRDLVAYNNNSE